MVWVNYLGITSCLCLVIALRCLLSTHLMRFLSRRVLARSLPGGVKGAYIFTHTFTEDEAIVGYSETYLYSDLQKYLDEFCKHPLVKRISIGKSRGGVNQDTLSITRNPDVKKTVFIISREDADEVTGSFSAEGMLNWAVSDDPMAVAFLNEYVLEFVPMVCIDGVIAGSTHSCGYGYSGWPVQICFVARRLPEIWLDLATQVKLLYAPIAVINDVHVAFGVAGQRPGRVEATGLVPRLRLGAGIRLPPYVHQLKGAWIKDLDTMIAAVGDENPWSGGMIQYPTWVPELG